MIFSTPAAPDPARRSKIDTFNNMKANNIIFSLNHISPKRNNIHSPGTSVDATRHTEGKAVLNVVVAAASAAAAAVVVVAVRQTDAQNGCLVGGLVAEEEEEEEEEWWWWW